jgi:hypothetical protein
VAGLLSLASCRGHETACVEHKGHELPRTMGGSNWPRCCLYLLDTLDLTSKLPETYFGTQDARAFPIKPHAGLVASVTHTLRLQRASVCLIRRHLLRDVGGIPGEEFAWDDTNAMQCSSSDAAVGRRPRAVRFGRPCKMVGMGHLKSWLKSHNKLGGFHLTCVEMGLPSITPIPF